MRCPVTRGRHGWHWPPRQPPARPTRWHLGRDGLPSLNSEGRMQAGALLCSLRRMCGMAAYGNASKPRPMPAPAGVACAGCSPGRLQPSSLETWFTGQLAMSAHAASWLRLHTGCGDGGPEAAAPFLADVPVCRDRRVQHAVQVGAASHGRGRLPQQSAGVHRREAPLQPVQDRRPATASPAQAARKRQQRTRWSRAGAILEPTPAQGDCIWPPE